MADFWKRFSRNRQAVLGLIILCVVIFVAAIANIIYPGDPFLYSKFPLSAPGENGFLSVSYTHLTLPTIYSV